MGTSTDGRKACQGAGLFSRTLIATAGRFFLTRSDQIFIALDLKNLTAALSGLSGGQVLPIIAL
jgi:hypothetical protein